ncbi:MAG: hypothetical protein E2O75_09850 [Chloroflexi bacterium]|nr:MAG: hypothetical protein E2O75_09850 [Chloroflexota bacterium]
MKRIKFRAIALVIVAGAVSSPAIASADHAGTPFLCPIVGDGVLVANENNGDNGQMIISPDAGTSFLPGKNQAGANANHSALNTDNPGNPDAGPGGNPDFSPIWPG